MMALQSEKATQAWLDEWIYGCPDHKAYLKHHIDRYGLDTLNNLKARAFYSAPANYGAAFTSVWDERDHERTLGVTIEELEQFMSDKGVLYE